jgi:hypothetical protein
MADGTILNEYSAQHWADDPAPTVPWAMYLAGDDHRFRYLCFDLDASKGNAGYDAGRLSHWLDELNIDHLVCASGPTGGRHVWIALTDPLDAEPVKALADLAVQLLPSLDVTPLSNPVTGCVRPPGAPHRGGGVSVPHGDVRTLMQPRTTPEAAAELHDFLIDLGAEITRPPMSTVKGMTYDGTGHPHLIGVKRPLSARIRSMLTEPVGADASFTLVSVLAGCAHARWRYSDVAALLDHSPALEHARTVRAAGGRRIPRDLHAAEKVLAARWADAVYYVASNPIDATGNDYEFTARANAAAAAVEAVQNHANVMRGLWSPTDSKGSYAPRAVLDALCLYIVQSTRLTVEADIRRLSADTGWGRTQIRNALHQLATPTDPANPESAWIIREGEPTAPHGQRYRLSKKLSTTTYGPNRPQVLARPTPLPPRDRTWWINFLTQDLAALAQDVFSAPHSLGRTTGLTYKALRDGAVATLSDLVTTTGTDPGHLHHTLARLTSHGLIQRVPGGWARNSTSPATVAETLDVAGYLVDRQARYNVERGVWAWWLAEYGWMTKARKKRRARRSPTGAVLFTQNDRPDYARYPRGPNSRGDHRAAKKLIEAGALRPLNLAAIA